MSVEQVFVLFLGFVFGWLGKRFEDRNLGENMFHQGYEDGITDAFGIANCYCKHCADSGEPNPVRFEAIFHQENTHGED